MLLLQMTNKFALVADVVYRLFGFRFMISEYYSKVRNFRSNHLNFYDFILGRDTCQADSGGPLMVRAGKESPMYLRGVLSFGSNKCGVGYPGVFTNIEAYIPWIENHMYKEV